HRLHSRLRRTPFPISSPTKSPPPPSPPRAIPESQDPKPPIRLRHISAPLHRLRDVIKIDELGRDILGIAVPAALALVADPITSLVDTAFVGHLGSVELAAVGVSVSVFNFISKLFNVPLLNITTSFVAEEQAVIGNVRGVSAEISRNDQLVDDGDKILLPSVSTSLALAAVIGFVEAVALSVGSGFLMNIMGISVDSTMRLPAEQFLSVRAFGAPPIIIALAAQGAFRGFKDTKTPLFAIGKYKDTSFLFTVMGLVMCSIDLEICFLQVSCIMWTVYLVGNIVNAILDPILIFVFGLGAGGAAIATVISEYLIALILLWKLNEKVCFVSPSINGRKALQFVKSGSLLIFRSLAVVITMTLATSMAARQGPIPMAGHQICMQVWLALSLLTDALALAGQALLAGDFSEGNYKQAREVIRRVLQIGVLTGIGLAVILFLGFGFIPSLFTSDIQVQQIAWSGVWFVAGSQPMNAIAFVLDGLYYGASDFRYAAVSMILAATISSILTLLAPPSLGLNGIWGGLFLFMSLRVAAGCWRFSFLIICNSSNSGWAQRLDHGKRFSPSMSREAPCRLNFYEEETIPLIPPF
ncbi:DETOXIFICATION 44, chloroplastic-like protein, partial [Drosera capensis]